MLVLLAAGVALGGLWAWLAPGVADRGDPAEARVAVDGTLALILLGAGLVTAIGVAVRPGRQPALRLVAALVGSLAGGLLAWLVGHLTGLSVGAPAITLLWALALAVLTALRALAGLVVTPASSGPLGSRKGPRQSAGDRCRRGTRRAAPGRREPARRRAPAGRR